MNEPLTPARLAELREHGPVGYHCNHDDEPLGAKTHHEWEWADGEGWVFRNDPDVFQSLTFPNTDPDRQQQCPRAVPVYAVDVPALVDEIARLRGVEADYERFKEHNGASLLQGFIEGLDRSARAEAEVERLRAELAGIRARAHARSDELLAARDARPSDDRLRRGRYEYAAHELRALVKTAPADTPDGGQ